MTLSSAGRAAKTTPGESGDDGLPVPAGPSAGSGTGRRLWRSHRATVVVMVVGLAITGAFSAAASATHRSQENRLLRLQTQQAAATVRSGLSTLQTPLEAAYDIYVATGGDLARVDRFVDGLVGPKGPFASISVWRVGSAQPTVLSQVGSADLAQHQASAARFLARVQPSSEVYVTGILEQPDRRIGIADRPGKAPIVLYGEVPLPADQRVKENSSSPYADLSIDLYLGAGRHAGDLLEQINPVPALSGYRAVVEVSFGHSTITLVAARTQQLTGGLSADLPWIVALVGVLVTAGAMAATERLVARRQLAETLAAENQQLYAEQRMVAGTLQRALLPVDLATIGGLDVAVRYLPGTQDLEIGGDWYDWLAVDDDHGFFAVGDVSGRGLAAASTMAALRYATRAYVAQGDDPATVVAKLRQLMGSAPDGRFATFVCGTAAASDGQVVLGNAGHLPILLVDGGTTTWVRGVPEPPIGVVPAPSTTTSVVVPSRATLVVFTDGLVERRGESIDDGLARAAEAAEGWTGTVDALLDHLVQTLTPQGSDDDVALLGLQWNR